MKQILIIPLLLITIFSCTHEYNNSLELKTKYLQSSYPEQILVGEFTSSTGSQDLYITQGEVYYPKEIAPPLYEFIRNNINVCGMFPMELIEMGNISHNPNLVFEIQGKIIEYKGNIPLFYVTTWSSWEE
jgi:hypothetical protein